MISWAKAQKPSLLPTPTNLPTEGEVRGEEREGGSREGRRENMNSVLYLLFWAVEHTVGTAPPFLFSLSLSLSTSSTH